jgi:glycosyltransferase involved in cell wall biosynthesis
MLTCLWLSRAIPFPLINGDRKYSAKLAEAFAAAGVAITFVGLAGTARPESVNNIEWRPVEGSPRGRAVSLLSTLPLVAARHWTSEYRAELCRLLSSKTWDIIAIDYCGMSWVLDYLRRFATGSSILVFITHNHEETLTRQQWQDTKAGLGERLYLLQNYLKTRRLEQTACRASDLLTANTETDAVLFQRTVPGARIITLTPGYDGPRIQHRQITTATPRAAVMFGAYHWSVKQTNLRIYLDHADAQMHKAGIEIRIVGDIPSELRSDLERRYVSARFTGFVEDPAPHLDARLGVVAEPIGGGFKHKLLDYIFNRVPVVALESCVVGLPESVTRHVLTVPDLQALNNCVETVIDDYDRLNALQEGAFEAAERAFDWADRGKAMQAAIAAIGQSERHLVRRPR